MKTTVKHIAAVFTLALLFVASGVARQASTIQYFVDPGKERINLFETPKTNTVEFNGLKVHVGGDFALQFQTLSQSNDFVNGVRPDVTSMAELSNNFSLPTANLNIDVQLEDGVRMHLRTYMSSRHHTEAYVKGGYLQIDKLDFIEEGFLSDLMEVVRIKVGMDDINYGDAIHRRSDNAAAFYNPFVGNYLMDSFTTEPFFEVTYLSNGIIGVLGATNGRLNQSPTPGDDGFVVYGKLGYDTQVNDDLRFRITGSFYNSTDKGTRDYLYGGDRAGSRYYGVMNYQEQISSRAVSTNDFGGRFNPGFASQTAFMVNPFVKFSGIEFFGLFEMTSDNGGSDASFTHLGAELLYRFGATENFYLGGRFNTVTGDDTDQEVSRINVGGGWFLTNNILTKLEFVNQTYSGSGFDGSIAQGAEFSGLVLEAVIAF